MPIGKRTVCENCGSTLRWYDGIDEVHQGWWELVAEQGRHETYRAHPPQRCRSIKSGADQLVIPGQMMIHNTEWDADFGVVELPPGGFENYARAPTVGVYTREVIAGRQVHWAVDDYTFGGLE
ncbi:MAG: hypothetical protein JWO67_3823 [Streptosporangiaceae bacterium]|nr:hypothetical protein [Streptosporangiaceae bacterium]